MFNVYSTSWRAHTTEHFYSEAIAVMSFVMMQQIKYQQKS